MEIHFHFTTDEIIQAGLTERLRVACLYRLPWAFLATVKWAVDSKGWFSDPWF